MTAASTAPSTVAELMNQHGLTVTEKDLVAALDEALIGRTPRPGSATLSSAAQQFLDEHGGIPATKTPNPAADAATTTAANMIALIETSLTGEQAAQRLSVDASTVRGRLSRKELYAIRVGRKNRLPLWQFTAEGALPHLGEVLSELPSDLHPLEVEALFTLPTADLSINNEELSPRAWLAAGGAPAPVVELAGGLRVAP